MKKPDLRLVEQTLKDYHFPRLVIIEVVAKCNLKCIMCPQSTMDKPAGKMRFAIWKKIIDEIAERDPSVEVWPAIMGEPLLLGDTLIKMITYAKKKGIRKVILNTNAMLLNSSLCAKLIKSGVDQLIFGIDAATPHTYKKIRRGGDLEQVESNIMHLAKMMQKRALKRPLLIAQFIEMDENTHEIGLFKEIWLKRGVAVKLRSRLGWGYGVKADNLKFESSTRIPCPWIMRTMSIHWNGKVAQCDADYQGHFYAGDLNFQNMDEVWNGELLRRRNLHWKKDWPTLPCGKCNDWKAGFSEFYFPKQPDKVVYKSHFEEALNFSLYSMVSNKDGNE